jgi:hypothetical protein
MLSIFIVAIMIYTVNQITFYLLLLLLFFCLGSFINEALGVTLSETSVSFPRRVSQAIPLLSFGRKSIHLNSIYQLQILKNSSITRNYREQKLKNSGLRRCILITNQIESFEIVFPQKSLRDLFTLTLDIYNPGISLSRRIAPPRLLISGPVIAGLNFMLALLASVSLALPYLAEHNQRAYASQKKSPVLLRTISNEVESDYFLLHAATYDWGTTSKNKVMKKLQDLQKCSGITLKLTTNSEYKFLTPTKKWLITAGPYPEYQANVLKDKLISCGASDLKVKEAEIEE